MKVWGKLLDWLGFEEEVEEEDAQEDEMPEMLDSPRFRPNVVELQSAKNLKLVVLGPKSYEDVQMITDHLRAKRPVVVNLEGAEPRTRVRILDFLSGAVYALGGRSQRVSDLIFLLAPTNVDISNLLEEEAISQLEKNRKTGGL